MKCPFTSFEEVCLGLNGKQDGDLLLPYLSCMECIGILKRKEPQTSLSAMHQKMYKLPLILVICVVKSSLVVLAYDVVD
jgi:hypothetical protein